MVITMIKPVMALKLTEFQIYTENLSREAQNAVIMGEEMAAEEMRSIISEKTRAYILDKAEAYGAKLTVEISLEGNIPCGVKLGGAVSPSAKQQLSAWIAENLGIPMEAQEWTGAA